MMELDIVSQFISETIDTDTSENNLIRLFKLRDPQALSIFTDEHAGTVTWIVYTTIEGYVDEKNESRWKTAERITIDVFMYIWENIDQYKRRKASFKTWIARRAKYFAFSFNRKVRKERELANKHLGDGQKQLNYDPTAKLLERIALDTVLQKLSKKSEGKAQIIKLRYLKGKSYQEIAEILNCPEGTVKSRLNRAIQELRKLF